MSEPFASQNDFTHQMAELTRRLEAQETELARLRSHPSRFALKLPKSRLLRASSISLLLLTFFSTVALASIPASDGTISACYNLKKDTFRVIDTAAGGVCDKKETALSWNQKGPKGDTGPVGTQGPKGDTGPIGPQGPAGQLDPNRFCQGCLKNGVNLSNLDLSGAYLPFVTFDGNANKVSGVILIGAYMPGAFMSKLDLSDANLNGAYLGIADLSGANLSRAGLGGAYLSGANMVVANLSGAYLTRANLANVDLRNANLTNANLELAVGIPAATSGVIWNNTFCPDSTNSNNNGGTCDGHFRS